MSTDMSHKRDIILKIVVIGDTDTGKTALVKRYTNQPFSPRSPRTIGNDLGFKTFQYDSHTLRLIISNVAGQERRYGNMAIHLHFREAVGCAIVFDLTRDSTFEAVLQWKTILDREIRLPNGDPIPCILLANKCDLVRADSKYNPERLNDFCRERGFSKWLEISAQENINVQESFQYLLDKF